jgi:monoglucosyldiacylglycerol epimerase
MDFPLPFGLQLLLGLLSIVLAELVRDCYHLAGHYWRPLQRLHMLHHKAYRQDLSITSQALYQQAQLYNDVPESAVMVAVTALTATISGNWGIWLGALYSLCFLVPAVARSQGQLLFTDFAHKAGDLTEIPSHWTVNRTYHWRHHFDQKNAYYSGHFNILDRLLGTSLSLKGKVVGVTGASGAMGQALIEALLRQGAKPVAFTTGSAAFTPAVQVVQWQPGAESDLRVELQALDILIINHGVNLYGDYSAAAIQTAYEVNAFSAMRLAELFLETVTESSHRALKELWVNTSEAEVNPAFSPLYELSKRTLGDLITLRRLNAPCVIRKLVFGPFKSQLNPYGVMSPSWVATLTLALAKRDFRDIIITINPITYLLFPVKELFQTLYFRLCRSR